MADGTLAGVAATLWVAAAVLVEDGKVMLTQRSATSDHAGMWEFPGGKIEPGEPPRSALQRELREELALDVAVNDILELVFLERQSGPLALLFFAVTRLAGATPKPLQVADIRWYALDALPIPQLTAADRVMARRLAEPVR